MKGVLKSLSLGLLLLVAACAVPEAPRNAATGKPIEEITGRWKPVPVNDTLLAADGVKLPMRVWLPEDGAPIKAVIVALHGFNDYSNAFAVPAKDWATHGIATYAYDQRGFGDTAERGFWVGRKQLDEDVATATHMAHQRHPGLPVYLLGESMGGAIIVSAVTGEAGAKRPEVDGIILSAPAVWGRETMNVVERTALWVVKKVAPRMTLTGSGLKIWPSDNIEMLRGLSRDPMVIKETRVDAIDGLVDLMSAALKVAPDVQVPMLLLYGEKDQLVPKVPTKLMIERLPTKAAFTRRIAWYPKGYHMLLRDLEAPVVLNDIEAWIDNHNAPLPSAADLNASKILFAQSAKPVETQAKQIQAMQTQAD